MAAISGNARARPKVISGRVPAISRSAAPRNAIRARTEIEDLDSAFLDGYKLKPFWPRVSLILALIAAVFWLAI